jgi:hypothetical protein
VELHVVGVKNYDEACEVAKELVNQGITAINSVEVLKMPV